MHRRLAAERCPGELTASVRDHLVHVHVELGTAACHPDVQGEHVVMLAAQDLVADLDDQSMRPVVEPLAGMVRIGGGLLQGGIGGDHLARDQILPDAEVLERALGLGAPKAIGGNLNLAETVGFNAKFSHCPSPGRLNRVYSPASICLSMARGSVAVRPATRRTPSGTRSMWMCTGTRWTRRTQARIGFTQARPRPSGSALGTLIPRAMPST